MTPPDRHGPRPPGANHGSQAASAESSADADDTTRPLDAWITKHQGAVWRYLRFLGADAELARDLTQEAFVACLRAGAVQRGDRPAAALLRQTARHRLISHLRTMSRRPKVSELDEGEAAWQWFAGSDGDRSEDSLRHLRACLDALPPTLRRAVDGAYTEGLGRQELGRELGLKPEGVKALMRRARQNLRVCIERKLSGDPR